MHDQATQGPALLQRQTSTPNQSSTDCGVKDQKVIAGHAPSPSSTQDRMPNLGQSSAQCQQSTHHHSSFPVAAMVVTSFTHSGGDQVPPPDHLGRNNNLVLDQTSFFLAGGIGSHFGGFVQTTYDGVTRHVSWDNMDLRAVAESQLFGQDATFGLSFNNNPTVQDPWNTLKAWSFPFTDTAVSPTPTAAPLIDGALTQNVFGLTAYSWIAHKFYVEAGAYLGPSAAFLRAFGVDPNDPGSIHGAAPYGRTAFQTDMGGGTFEFGASALKAALFPGRDRSSGLTDHYTDLGLDASWQRTLKSGDLITANFRYEHERANLRASCVLELIGNSRDPGCARYRLNEWRGAMRYTGLHDRLGLTLSPFSITGSRNVSLFESGSPSSNGLMGQVDYTFWPDGHSPFGSLFNIRVGAQYTAYRKFDGRPSNGPNKNALRLFAWIAY